MKTLKLDRIEIEDVGANPARLAAAVLAQLGPMSGPLPVDAIARALDIVEIRCEPLSNFEGALVTTPERSHGQILVNASSHSRRRRFTIAHELGHFLNPWHLPTAPSGFWCNRSDFRAGAREKDRHRRQEAQANLFAIELLAPRDRLRQYLVGAPDLTKALEMSDSLDISREAAARRYVELHVEQLAVVFSHDGRVVYTDHQEAFPRLSVRPRGIVPELPARSGRATLSDIEEADAAEWLVASSGTKLTAQTLYQRDGWAMTLLHAETLEDQDDESVENADEYYARFSRR